MLTDHGGPHYVATICLKKAMLVSTNIFRVLRNPLYLGRENVRKESEKQERGKTKRNEKHALRTGVALAVIAYMLSVCRRESLVHVPSFWTEMDFLTSPSPAVKMSAP